MPASYRLDSGKYSEDSIITLFCHVSPSSLSNWHSLPCQVETLLDNTSLLFAKFWRGKISDCNKPVDIF